MLSRPTRRSFAALGAGVVLLAACGDGSSGEPVVSEPADQAAEPADEPEGCPPAEGIDGIVREFSEAPPMCLEAGVEYSAILSTSAGDITVALDPEQAPLAVNNFVFLARNNYFDDTVCHRVVTNFVAQCGDPTASGRGGPGYTIDDEFPEAGDYEIGSVVMAKTTAPNSAGSQFFIISGENGLALPPQYSLFGQSVGEGDLEVIAEMDARGSAVDGAPMNGEVRILDVEIIES